MHIQGSDNTGRLWLLACLLPLLAGGCGGEKTTSNSLSNNSPPSVQGGGEQSGNDEIDLGGNILESQPSQRSSRRGGDPANRAAPSRPSEQASTEPFYAIVLKTFDGDSHQMAAETMVRALPQVAPDLARRARVHTMDSGSMVIVGRYDTRDDPEARDELMRIRQMQISGTPVFARVMLARITPEAPEGQLHPFDLRTVRKRLPEYNFLYTVDVAVWLDPAKWGDEGAAEDLDIQQEAEQYATRLRAAGHEAYFYHDPDRGVSTVTVGVIGAGGILDPSVGLLHPAVEDIRRQFTPRQVNGIEEFQVRDAVESFRDPDARQLVAQKPQLVEIPK